MNYLFKFLIFIYSFMIKNFNQFRINEGYEYDNSGKYTKLIKKSSMPKIDRREVDPYCEEDWSEEDNEKLNWDKIKIVHPNNDINKKVLIIKGTRYYTKDTWNPSDVIGTIHNIRHRNFFVAWNNGSENNYKSEDLTLIEEEII